MARTVEYKYFTIQSAPQYRTEWREWQLRITISCDTPHGVRTRDLASEVMYPTEQEADIHGITLGQRLIDGKVDGRSAIDLNTVNRRGTPRFQVQFRTTFSDSMNLEGIGMMLDLSLSGCRVESPVMVAPGLSLELRILLPDVEWPIMIEAARVQRMTGQTFGLAFLRIKDIEQQRLGYVIKQLRADVVMRDG